MNATWKSWLHRLMNRGTSAVKALGFTTRRPSRMLRMPRMRSALGALALSGALGTAAWGQAPGSSEGVVKLGGGAATVNRAQGVVGLSDPSASMAAAPAMVGQIPASPQQQYVAPYNPYQQAAPRIADRTWQNYEQGMQSQGGVGYAQTQDVTQILYRAGTFQGNAYGVNGPNARYTSLNAFIPLGVADDGDSLWWVQPRANVTNNGSGIANVGAGYRWYTPEDDRVWGASFWWDGDGGHHSWYNQLGANFMSVGKYLSWRGGFALPIGSTDDSWGRNVSNIFYVGDGIGFNVASNFEQAYRRYNIEAATPIPFFGRYGWEVGVGTYYLNAPRSDDALGVSCRVEAQVTEDFWINSIVTSDRLFGGNVSLNMELTLPDGSPSRWMRPKRVKDALTESDKRNYRVAARTSVVTTQERAINPLTGLPIKVAHIDPNLLVAGDGTVEHPFESILQFDSLADLTQATYDIIFVERRTDGTDTNLNTGVTLFDGQRLLGNGTLPLNGLHTFQALVNGNLGTFVLPGQTAGALPLLSNTGNLGHDVVTLANSNEVSGFIINASNTAAAIRGTGINGFNINSIGTMNAVDGVVITSDTSVPHGLPLDGIGIIANNLGADTNGNGVIDPAEDANGNGVLDPGEDINGNGKLDAAEDPTGTGVKGIMGSGFGSNRGVSITHVAGNLDLVVRNNFIGGFLGEDRNNNGILDPSEDINLNGKLDPGEDLNANGKLDVAEDTNNNGLLDRGVGLEVIATNGAVINANGTAIPLGNDPYAAAGTTTGIHNNVIDGNGFGASLQSLNGATFNADVTNNTIRNSVTGAASGGAGIEIIADAAVINLDKFQSNFIYDNAFYGANVVSQNGGLITIDDGVDGTAALSGNVISGNGDDGMRIVANGASVVIDQISNNIFGTEDLNLNGVLDSGEDLNGNGQLDGGNGNNGLEVITQNTGVVTVGDPITGNRFNGNTQDGLALVATSGTIAMDIGANNQFANNGDDGLSMTVGPTGFISSTLLGDLTLGAITATGNAGAGVEILIDGGTVQLADIRNNAFNNNGIGLSIINNNGGTFSTPTIASNNFNDNTEAGLFIGGTGGATVATTDLGTIIGNTFNRTANGFYGIEFNTLDVQVNAVARQNTFIGRGAASGEGIGGTVGGNGGLNLDLAPNDPANGNLFRANGDAHIGVILEGHTVNVINIANHVFDSAVDSTNATFGSSFFGGDGVSFVMRQESSLTGSVSSSQFTNNQGDGLHLEIFSQSLTGFATLNNFTIGGATQAQGNLFNGNLDDGIQVSRTGSGQVNNVVIQNNLIQNTGITNNAAQRSLDRAVNGSATSFNDGGAITEVVDANPGETTGSPFVTEGDDGIYIASRGLNTQDTYHILDNTITNNSDNAVHFRLSGEASINVEMRRNTLDTNEGNGLAITEESAFVVGDTHYLTGVIADNTFRNNQFNGIYEAAPTDGLQVGEAGAAFSNIITGNGLNGVTITGVDSPQNAYGSELPSLQNPYSTRYLNNLVANNTGAGNQITRNQITGNVDTNSLNRASINSAEQAGHGFDIDTAVDKVIRIEDNEIRNNAHDGIEFQNGTRHNIGGDGFLGTSTLQVVNNLIEFNGDRGIDILNKLNGITAVSSIIVIENNNVSNNEEEGVYIVNTNSPTQRQNVSSSVNLQEDGGIGGDAFLQVTMRGNEILGNGVNVDQTPAGLAPGGPIRASGLVLRVGTSGGGYSVFETGGFATVTHQTSPDTGYPVPLIDTQGVFEEDFNSNGILDPGEDLNGDGVLNTTELDRNRNGILDPSEDVNHNGIRDRVGLVNGGILMEMTNNTFAGNFGDDIFIHSFRSTVDPATSNGTWSATQFGPFNNTLVNGDPLARLDLIYGNNSFVSAELTPRNITPHPGTTDGDTGAYYNNDESRWKSNTARPTDPTAGPFQSGTRRRNAQRLADRVYASGTSLPPGPGQPEGGNLVLYAGMGDSTFRVRGVLDMAPTTNNQSDPAYLNYLAKLSAEGFVLDDYINNIFDPPGSPIEDFREVNGTPFIGGTQFGELPFGWGVW